MRRPVLALSCSTKERKSSESSSSSLRRTPSSPIASRSASGTIVSRAVVTAARASVSFTGPPSQLLRVLEQVVDEGQEPAAREPVGGAVVGRQRGDRHRPHPQQPVHRPGPVV